MRGKIKIRICAEANRLRTSILKPASARKNASTLYLSSRAERVLSVPLSARFRLVRQVRRHLVCLRNCARRHVHGTMQSQVVFSMPIAENEEGFAQQKRQANGLAQSKTISRHF
jgi:hypothetical protein